MIARCLSCNCNYRPDPNLPAIEYPYCGPCNSKETLSLVKLRDIVIAPYNQEYKSRPSKRQGQKTFLHLQKRKKIRRERFGIYENSTGALAEGMEFAFN